MYSFFEQRFMGDYYNPQKSIFKKAKKLKQLTKENQKAKIVSALIQKGITQKALASDIGVSTQFLGEVISGKSRSHRVEQKITEVTGYEFPVPQRVPRTLNAANN